MSENRRHTDNAAVASGSDLQRIMRRIAHEIVESNWRGESGLEAPAIVGIHTRGAILAHRLHAILTELTGVEFPLGEIDISFYRDDVGARYPEAAPIVRASHLEFELTARTVVLVDDVLFTGRTVRAAIDALFDYGRPARIQLAVLVDRGHRELPIRPDYVGKNIPTGPDQHVFVHFEECDGEDAVIVGPPRSRTEAVL